MNKYLQAWGSFCHLPLADAAILCTETTPLCLASIIRNSLCMLTNPFVSEMSQVFRCKYITFPSSSKHFSSKNSCVFQPMLPWCYTIRCKLGRIGFKIICCVVRLLGYESTLYCMDVGKEPFVVLRSLCVIGIIKRLALGGWLWDSNQMEQINHNSSF